MKSIFKALLTVSAFAVLTRIFSFIFKVYLSRQLGAQAMGVYQVALSVFFMLLTATTSGIPLVVSRLIAKERTSLKTNYEGKIVGSALLLSIIASVIICFVILAGQGLIKQAFASAESFVCLLLLLPALVSASLSSAFKGAIWGRGSFAALSVIDIVEQVLRIILCVIFFNIGTSKLQATAITFSISCVLACAICIAYYYKTKGRVNNPRTYLGTVFKQSVPITAVRASSSLISSALAFAIPFLFMAQGLAHNDALALLGASVGMAFSLLYMPNTLVSSLAYVMVPSISANVANKNTAQLQNQIHSAICFSIIVACAFIAPFMAVGQQIGSYVYANNTAGQFLQYGAWLILPIALESITSSMMNSVNLEKRSLVNFLIGSAVMFIIMFCFYKKFSLFIFSIAFGTSLTLSSILDLIAIVRKVNLKLDFIKTFIKCAVLIFPSYFICKSVFSLFYFAPTFVALAVSCAVSFAFFVVLIYVFDIAKMQGFTLRKSPKQKLQA